MRVQRLKGGGGNLLGETDFTPGWQKRVSPECGVGGGVGTIGDNWCYTLLTLPYSVTSC